MKVKQFFQIILTSLWLFSACDKKDDCNNRGGDYSHGVIVVITSVAGLRARRSNYVYGSAKAGLDLYFAHRPRKPVVAVIYTHSHSDHYGGAKGVTSDADVAADNELQGWVRELVGGAR